MRMKYQKLLVQDDKINECQRYYFECPACKIMHGFNDSWHWNGDVNSPTVSPSILVTYPDGSNRCHLFIENGFLKFQQDCDHEMRGQIVEMIELSEQYFD